MAKILELSIIDNLAVAELLISSNYAGVEKLQPKVLE